MRCDAMRCDEMGWNGMECFSGSSPVDVTEAL